MGTAMQFVGPQCILHRHGARLGVRDARLAAFHVMYLPNLQDIGLEPAAWRRLQRTSSCRTPRSFERRVTGLLHEFREILVSPTTRRLDELRVQ